MIIPAGFAQVNCVFSGNSIPLGAEVVFGVENAGAFSASTIGGGVGTAWDTNVQPVQVDQLELNHVHVKLGPNSTGASADVAFGIAGGVASQELPPSVCVLASKITNLGGREGRGRMYWPGPTESQTDGGGVLNAGAFAAWDAAIAGFLADLTASAIPMVLLHTSSTAPTLVQELVTQQQFATQRDRLRR